MRICFVDLAPWDYNVGTPKVRPLGGSQSGMCYLAAALARLGHEVATLTHTSQPGTVIDGVRCLLIYSDLEFRPDATVYLNAPGGRIPETLDGIPARRILWTHHAANQIAMRKLADPAIRNAWDDIVCVSDWQAGDVAQRFGVDRTKITVLRNAIAPAFEGLFESKGDLVKAKSGSPRLAYTSTPYRGLQFLTSIFPAYRAKIEAELDVYSSMSVYMDSLEKDRSQFGWIYDPLDKIERVNRIGSLPQPELAKRLAKAHILAYPNAFPETSCIAVMEAMAAGLQVVTSDLGALPETCEGFANLVPIEVDIDDTKASIHVKNGADYIAAFTQALIETEPDPAKLFAQVQHMNQHHTWDIRAKQWTEFLHG